MKILVPHSTLHASVLLLLFLFFSEFLSAQGLYQNQFLNAFRWKDVPIDQAYNKQLAGDFNGDGLADMAVRGANNTWQLISANEAVNTKKQSDPLGVDTSGNGLFFSGDFDGDGLSDKLRIAYCSLYVSLTHKKDLSSGYYTYIWDAETLWGTVASNWSGFMIGDINGDGCSDIIYKNDISQFKYVSSNKINQFNPEQFWRSSGVSGNERWLGDFNADGHTDLLTKKSDGWYVALTDTVSKLLSSDVSWYSSSSVYDACLVKDFNGDQFDDIAYHNAANEWWVLLNYGTGQTYFWTAQRWTTGQGINSGVWAGDFNGDGKNDIVTRTTSISDPYWNAFFVAYSNNEPVRVGDVRLNERKVGVWYWPAYYTNGTQVCSWDQPRDPNKTPVVGWGTDAVSGLYSCQDPITLGKQLNAISKCNIDFIVADMTNGFLNMNPPIMRTDTSAAYTGDGCGFNGTGFLFQAIQTFNGTHTKKLKAAIASGIETWGPGTFTYYHWEVGANFWADQNTRLRNAENKIWSEFVQIFPNEYYKYLGKPFWPLYTGEAFQLPFNQVSNRLPKWHSNKFTIRPVCTPNETFAYTDFRTTSWGPHDGTDTKRFWSFGSGMYDVGINDDHDAKQYTNEVPVNYEVMCIEPGYAAYNQPGTLNKIDRRGGELYLALWNQVLRNLPKTVLIMDWNNWTEEWAIEGCIGTSGWKDKTGTACYDWYMKITSKYAYMYKTDSLPRGEVTYFRIAYESGAKNVYRYSGTGTQYQFAFTIPDTSSILSPTTYPALIGQPVLVVPLSWLNRSNYTLVPQLEQAIKSIDLKAFPNPFNPATEIRYSIPEKARVKVAIYSILGSEVKILQNEDLTAGEHVVTFNASMLPSGVYFCRISAGNLHAVKKLMLIK